MDTRVPRLIGCFVLAAGMASLIAGPLSAQAPQNRAAKPGGIPRTADGRPDLQGTFNVATITPEARRVRQPPGADRRRGCDHGEVRGPAQ
jgi:hypothetical protein